VKGESGMEWLDNMNCAINYIEGHLEDKIDYTMIAQAACCSVYHFQRMFSFIANITLAEYIRRRRMTLAAFELQNSSIKVIDLAVKYGYDSPEAFTRAFQQLHGVTPTTARRQGVVIKAYPRISFQITIKGDTEMNYRIEEKESFQIYGIERMFETKDGENLKAIPEFWQEILENGEHCKLLKSTGREGIREDGLCPVNAVSCYRETEGTIFPYMIFAFEAPESKAEGYTKAIVPESTWAIFSTETHRIEETSSAIQGLIKRVYTDWLPTAGYEKLDGYEFEMYYQLKDGKYYEETWIRVRPKK
jgi:AraC family transcriptional regulator